MIDPREELAALVADLRAHLDARGGAGVRFEDMEASLPAAEPIEERAVDLDAVDHSGAWAELARTARAPESEMGATTETGLQKVRRDLGDCARCGLCKERQNLVFGVGDPNADLLVIGEAPGANEDRQGEPFVGPAGQMLDRMLLGVLGLAREEVYIANVVKCRPPNNRDPAPEEIERCKPFLDAQIEAVAPKVILIVGRIAMGALLGLQGIKRNRGRWYEYRGIPVMLTFHPAYLLRQEGDKPLTFADLKALAQRYEELGGRRTRPRPVFGR